ncbi:MAG: Karyopherin transporter [Vezdaea aestivalis]|nr:MAG: Karyopherin transporter [Vezdaea aestivalis]
MSMTVEELDVVVRAFYESRGPEQKQADQKLNQFKEDQDAWLLVDKILKTATYPQTKYLGLQILDSVITTRWKALPKEQCQGIRNFVVNYILENSASEDQLRSQRAMLGKLNLVLVSILKQDWPHNWPTFITEIIASCRSSLSICENNMAILRLLSEEVFDFSEEQMTSTKAKSLKNTMCNEFSAIFSLCNEVILTADQPSLIKATLETLLRFLGWIPLGYVFETEIIDTLRTKYLENPEYRNVTLKCLTEMGGLQISPGYQAYNEKLVQLFTEVLTSISNFIPLSLDLRSTYGSSNPRDQEFVQNLALFLCTFFTNHLKLVEMIPNQEFLVHGHFYLIRISQIDDREIFKICLEYWTTLVSELYDEMQSLPMSEITPLLGLNAQSLANGGAIPAHILANYPLRKHKYNEVLTNLRTVMIEKMVRPEEVLIVENDDGEIVREFVKESDTIQLYKTTRECLVYLTHLDVVDTETIMSDKLARQVDGTEWSWSNCNTLCWAIGSISGAMSEDTEKRFLVTVIKDLLGLTEMKRGKDNKAVVASNIMYIVGQYPRFLKAHWKFLKTVVNKLFEFMHESHEGVQDMACDTFIKIANKCRRHFVAHQPGENEPFIDEIVRTMSRITDDLTPQQVHTFYEACGYMINAQGQKNIQERLIQELMNLPNRAWDQIIQSATQDPSILRDGHTIKVIGNIMKTNVAACSSIGTYFYPQIGKIFLDMLHMYRVTSEMISEAVKEKGKATLPSQQIPKLTSSGVNATKFVEVRGLRTIKREILKLITTYVEHADDLDMVNQNIVPPLMDAILIDYNQNVPDARDAEVLNVMSAIITKLQGMMEDKVPVIMDNVFECTLNMINKDFSEYPEHRVDFFKLLRAINLHCFPSLLRLDDRQFKFVIDACLWASKHDNREVESAGLNMLVELVKNMASSPQETSNHFFKTFFLTILQDVFFVLTDTDHKAGFHQQATLMQRLFYLVNSNQITVPLYKPGEVQPGTTNKVYLAEHVSNLLVNAFPNVLPVKVQTFVEGLFEYSPESDYNKFKLNLRDFLIDLKEFSGSDNAELYAEEAKKAREEARQAEREKAKKVGGLIKPADLDDEDL